MDSNGEYETRFPAGHSPRAPVCNIRQLFDMVRRLHRIMLLTAGVYLRLNYIFCVSFYTADK